MSRIFVLFSLTVLFCFVSNHCAAHNIRAPCPPVNVCHHTERDNHVKGNYLSVKVLSDQEEKDNPGQIGFQKDAFNEQQDDGNVDANKEVEEAIKNAQEKVKTAEATINGILQNAEASKNDANGAEKNEVKEIEEAKTEADKVDSSITDVSKFVTVITQSQEKAKEKIKEATEKAESAVTKANDAKTKLETAKDELKKAKEIADENQKEQKKQKASDAGTKAENAETDAKSVETEKALSTKALSEVKQAHKNAQLALYKLKAIVEASKVDKAYESIKNNEKNIEKVKAEADAIIQTMTNVLHVFFDPLKEKGKKQYEIYKDTSKLLETEVKNVKNSEFKVKWRKVKASENAEKVKAQTSIDEAKKEYEKVEKFLSEAIAEEKNTITALNNAQVEMKKMQKTKLSFDAILNADNVYLAVVLSKEFEEKAKNEEQSAILNISEMETISTDDMTEESKKKITDQLDTAKNILKTFKNNVEAINKAKNDAESHKTDANKVVQEAENASDAVAAERAKNNSHRISLLALSEVVNAKNHFNNVAEKAQKIEKIKYEAKTIALAHEIAKFTNVTKTYVEEAKKNEKKAEVDFKEMEALLTDELTDVRQNVTQQINNAKQVLQHLNTRAIEVYSASRNTENQNEKCNDAMNNAQKASSAADTKREAQKATTVFSTAEKEHQKAQTALQQVKIDAAKIERAKHAAKIIIDANKMDQLYTEIKKDYDALVDKKRAFDTIVTAVQQIFNECPKEAHGEIKSYLQTSQAAKTAIESELNHAQQADKNTKQLNVETLTALTNVMKAETPLTELQAMTTKASVSIKVAQEKVQSTKSALIKAQTELDKAERARYVASVLLSSVKVGEAVRNVNKYKEHVTEKKKEAQSALYAIQSLHQSVSIGVSFIIINYLDSAEEIFETLVQHEINAANAQKKVQAAKEEADRFLEEVRKSDTIIQNTKNISEKAKAAEIRALSEEGRTKDVLMSVASDLAKIKKIKQNAENVNSKSKQTSSKPIYPLTSEKKSAQNETSEMSAVNERENEREENKSKHIQVKNTNLYVNNNNNTHTEKNVEKPSDSAVNPFYRIFVSWIIFFLGSHGF